VICRFPQFADVGLLLMIALKTLYLA